MARKAHDYARKKEIQDVDKAEIAVIDDHATDKIGDANRPQQGKGIPVIPVALWVFAPTLAKLQHGSPNKSEKQKEAMRQELFPVTMIITLELAIRYATDYLQGNRYFKIQNPDANLERATALLHYLDNMRSKQSEAENF